MVLKLKRKVPTANGRLALTSLSSIFPIIIHARATPIKITGIILLESDDKMLSGFDKIAIPNAANIKNNFSLYPYIFRSIAQTLRADKYCNDIIVNQKAVIKHNWIKNILFLTVSEMSKEDTLPVVIIIYDRIDPMRTFP